MERVSLLSVEQSTREKLEVRENKYKVPYHTDSSARNSLFLLTSRRAQWGEEQEHRAGFAWVTLAEETRAFGSHTCRSGRLEQLRTKI